MALGNMAFDSTAVFAPTTVTSANVIINLFKTNDVVYLRTDAVALATTRKLEQLPYKIVEEKPRPNAAGNYVQADDVTVADSTAAVSVSTVEGADDTAPEYPWFYRIQRIDFAGAAFGDVISVHEVDIVTLAGLVVLNAAVTALWADPTPA